MKLITEEVIKSKVLRDSAMSIPKPFFSKNISSGELEMDSCYCINGASDVLANIWNKQHPLIHTWLVLSSISICFLFVLFFVM